METRGDVDKTLEDAAVANLRQWWEADFRFVDLGNRIVRDRPSTGELSPGRSG